MKGMVLAAGFGIRLRPLTYKKPKPLVPILNIPIINYSIELLISSGVNEIIINTHYKHNDIENYMNSIDFPIPINIIFEPDILGTGGALKNAESLLNTDNFFLLNSDIITNINLKDAYDWHINKNFLATMIVHHYPRFRQILIDKDFYIKEIKEKSSANAFSFTGIHIINSVLLDYMPKCKFDIIDFYRHVIKKGLPIGAYVSSNHYWRDIGTIYDYFMANKEALKGKRIFTGKNCVIHPKTQISNWAIIGDNCIIDKNVHICSSILWSNTIVREGIEIINSIITGGEIKYNQKNIVA